MPPKMSQNVFVMHQGSVWPAQIVQVSCPQDVSKDELPALARKRAALEVLAEEDPSLNERIAAIDARITRAKDGPRLGGADELVDVTLLVARVPEDNGDPNHEKTKGQRTEYCIHGGLSNVRRAMNPGGRKEGTWWPREEDAAPKGGN